MRLLLPLVQEYQIDVILERCEDFLLSQASSVRNFLLAEKYNLARLRDSNMAYLKRAPVSRLRSQPEFDSLDATVLKDLLLDKCERFVCSYVSLHPGTCKCLSVHSVNILNASFTLSKQFTVFGFAYPTVSQHNSL